MSQENVEIIRRGYAHFAAGGDIRAHPDLVWDVSNLGWPDQQIYHGPAGAMQFNAEWAAAWDDWEMEAEDYIDAGDCVVVISTQRGRSKATGIPSTCASLKCGCRSIRSLAGTRGLSHGSRLSS